MLPWSLSLLSASNIVAIATHSCLRFVTFTTTYPMECQCNVIEFHDDDNRGEHNAKEQFDIVDLWV